MQPQRILDRCIAASSYSFHRLFAAGSHDLERDAATLAKQCSADAIEFALGPPLSAPPDTAMAERLRDACASENMPIVSVVVSAELYRGGTMATRDAVAATARQLEAAHRMGSPRFRHDATLGPENGDISDRAFDEALPHVADACRVIATRAADLGMQSSIENHGRFMQHASRLERLLEAVDHPAFGITLDVGNTLFADQDPVTAVRTLAPHATMVHLKDFVINPSPTSAPGPYEPADVWQTWPGGPSVLGCALGDGDIDLFGCLDAIREAGYAGPLSVEFEGPWPDPVTAMQRGIAYLREVA